MNRNRPQSLDTQSAPDLTVIVVNWNVGRLVKGCLQSLYRLTGQVSFEVFVVDNCSREGDLDEVVLTFPQVNYVFLKKNLGFAKANNVAIKLARGAFTALLNPDTYLLNNAFDLMVSYLRMHPAVGAIGPKLRTPDGGIQFDAAHNLPTLITEFSQQFFLNKLFPKSLLGGTYYIGWWDHQDARDVGALCGACMVVRSEVIKSVGPLDEDFFLYWEDVDWCYRIGRAGWLVTYQPEAEVRHLGGRSFAQDSAASRQASFKSCVHFFRKHYGLAAALGARALIFCGGILRIFLWLALSMVRRRRPEAKDRMRCYLRTVLWVLAGSVKDRAASDRLTELISKSEQEQAAP
jgi:GT2 family glycosyltransferase